MPSNDPHFGKVKLLLHMDDAALSDVKGHAVTKYGNVAFSASPSKWGRGAGLFDGSGDYLQYAASADWFFGTNAFTIECWIYIAANSATDGNGLRNAQIYTNMSASYGGFGFQIMGNASTTGTGLGWEDKYGGASIAGSISATVSQGVWHHVCCCRESGGATLYLGLDGTVYTTSITGGGSRSLGSNAYAVQIGGQPAVTNWNRYLNGRVNDLRLTVGEALYTDDYTPPAARFPDYGRYIAGDLTETSEHTGFTIRTHRLDTGALLNEITATGTAFECPCCPAVIPYTDYAGPVMVTAWPKLGSAWTAHVPKAEGDYCFPTDPTGTPYVYSGALRESDIAYCKLSVAMNGADSSTAFYDGTGRALTTYGNAQIKTDQYKFDGSSGYFDGTGDYVRAAQSNDFAPGTGDFTVELWTCPSSYATSKSLIDFRAAANDAGYTVYLKTDGKIGLFTSNADHGVSASAVTLNEWNHVAVCRASGVVKVYVNGTGGTGASYASSITAPGAPSIGADCTAGYGFSGHLCQVSVFIGLARYTDDFTPPAVPYYCGTSGTEPTWPTTPGNTVDDYGVTWTCVGRMLQPLIQGPLMPSI